MSYRYLVTALALAALLLPAGTAWTAAPEHEDREAAFAHVCTGGPNKGQSCTPPAEGQKNPCPKSQCEIDYITKPNGEALTITGTLTIIVNENVIDWNNPRSPLDITLTTVLLEVKKGGQSHLLTQTYQNCCKIPNGDETMPGWFELAAESNLGIISLHDKDLNGFISQQPESTLAQGLRDLFQRTGIPIIMETAKEFDLSNHAGDLLGSAVRFKVKIRFVNQ